MRYVLETGACVHVSVLINLYWSCLLVRGLPHHF
jgi:hypothetical protein